jgi:hypothetical protein
MTSGSGILHEEMPRRSPQGNVYGFQLWVNLPAARKMDQPRYQEVKAETIPELQVDGAKIRLVAGEINGILGPVAEIAADPIYLDVELEPGTTFSYPIPRGHTLVAYVFEGEAKFGSDELGAGSLVEAVRMVEFGDGEQLQIQTTPDTGVRSMLIAGAPFNEPIVPYGPFVMNTPQEIQQALADLRNGTFVKT